MIRQLVRLGVVVALLGATPAGAADSQEFSRPDSATEVVRSDELPFQLWYDPDKWEMQSQDSGYAMFARVAHKDGGIVGAFTYQDDVVSEDAVRKRVRQEIEAIFASHEFRGFERRRVNGRRMLYMKASGTTRGEKELVVRAYYWIGPEGVADYGLMIDREVFEGRRGDIADMLNGLEIEREDEDA